MAGPSSSASASPRAAPPLGSQPATPADETIDDPGEDPAGQASTGGEDTEKSMAQSAAAVGRLLLEAQLEADRILGDARRRADEHVSDSESVLADARARARRLWPTMRALIIDEVAERDRQLDDRWSQVRGRYCSRLDLATPVLPPSHPSAESRVATSLDPHYRVAAPVSVVGAVVGTEITGTEAPANDPAIGEEPQFGSLALGATEQAWAPKSVGAHRRRHGPSRVPRGRYGTMIRNLGLLLLIFCAYQLWGTSLIEARSQDQLQDSFVAALTPRQPPPRVVIPESGATAQRVPQSTPGTTVPDALDALVTPVAPPEGAVALLRIPKIGLEKAVVNGTSVDDLKSGPGHYAGTPMPGSPGNVAIAGHRTTYGAPFRDLDQLAPGDEIEVVTLEGTFGYEVSEPPMVVAPDADEVLGDFGDTRLTLTTCHPKFRASQRLIVVAMPVDAPPAELELGLPTTEVSAPAPHAGQPGAPTASDGAALSTEELTLAASGSGAGWIPGVAWAVVFAGLLMALRPRGGNRTLLRYLLVAPVMVFVLLNLFESINGLLPAGV